MKKLILTSILCLFIALSFCLKPQFLISNSQEVSTKINYLYDEKPQNINDAIELSTNVVKATLLSKEDFDGNVDVYLFSVDEDYTSNTPSEINVYDAESDNYIVGNTYYLFLEGTDIALYPHTIYTSVKKDLIIDVTLAQIFNLDNNDTIQELTKETEEKIINTNVNDVFNTRMNGSDLTVSDDINIASIVEEADIVAIIQIYEEENANKYASSYKVNLINTLKGGINDAIGQYMILPPNLHENTNYYVFLKEDPANPGTYLLFSRVMPVLEAAEDTISEISMILE